MFKSVVTMAYVHVPRARTTHEEKDDRACTTSILYNYAYITKTYPTSTSARRLSSSSFARIWLLAAVDPQAVTDQVYRQNAHEAGAKAVPFMTSLKIGTQSHDSFACTGIIPDGLIFIFRG